MAVIGSSPTTRSRSTRPCRRSRKTAISKDCVPPGLMTHMLPCSLSEQSGGGGEESLATNVTSHFQRYFTLSSSASFAARNFDLRQIEAAFCRDTDRVRDMCFQDSPVETSGGLYSQGKLR